MINRYLIHLLFLYLLPNETTPFILTPPWTKIHTPTKTLPTKDVMTSAPTSLYSSNRNDKELSIYLDPTLTPERIRSLFAWISRAFAGEPEYNNLMLGMAAVFGANVAPQSPLLTAARNAEALLPSSEEELTGAPIPLYMREQSSLGAMGAAQWTGQWKTRPHSLLVVSNLTSVDEWVKELPRGCRRTLKKADAQNFTVVSKPIFGGRPAPHSSLSHFRCVVEHEVRTLQQGKDDVEGFFDGLSEAVGRYVGTTRMAGTIREYRSADGHVIAFAHEVKKGRTVRGQWFYATDEAAKRYVWFHSVKELVRRAIEDEGVDTVDLGPSGSWESVELKGRYGFESVDDWPAVADYEGPFWYEDDGVDDGGGRGGLMELLNAINKRR